MIDIQEFLRRSQYSLVLYFLHRLRKTIHMSALISSPTPFSSSSSSSSLRWLFIENVKTQRNFKHENNQNAVQENGLSRKPMISRKWPAQLQVLAYSSAGSNFADLGKKFDENSRSVVEVEGGDYFVASKKGKREVMEDAHAVILDISCHSKQAFFLVIDGHGGRGAVDYVAENLGKNIVEELQVERVGVEGNNIEDALRRGYSVTDKQFLLQGKNGGACAASVLIKDG